MTEDILLEKLAKLSLTDQEVLLKQIKFEDNEILSSGSIIHWDDVKSLPMPVRKRRCIGITCGDCKEIRYKPLDTIKIQLKKPGFTGRCQKCINLRGQKIKTKCDFCGSEMEVNRHAFEKLDHHFCYRDCYKKWFRAGGYKLRGYNLSEAGHKALSEGRMGEKNPRYRAWQKMSAEDRQLWIETMKDHQTSSFTYPEILLMLIIDEYKLPYKYVGDGGFWIENINPDFVNTNNEKIIIEVFGDYWHNLPHIREKDFEKETILKEYGWKRIVLWEQDLKESSSEDIANFIRRSGEVYHSIY